MTKISVEEFNEAIGRLVKERDNLLTQGNLKEARRLGTIRTSLKEWFEAGQTEELPAETREVLATFLLDGNSASPVPPPEANKQAEELKREAEQLRAEDLKREAERQRAEELKRETERQRLEELKREAERQRAEDLKREAERQHAEELKREAERQHAEELKREAERQHAEDLKREAERQRLVTSRSEAQRLADKARQTSDLLTAIKLWEEVIKRDPTNSNYQLELDKVRDHLKLKKEISDLLAQGEQAFKAKKYSEAQQSYSQAENRSSDPGEQQVIRERLSLIAQEEAKSSERAVRLSEATQIIREIEQAIRDKQAPSLLLKLIRRGQELIGSGWGNPVLEKKLEEAENYHYELMDLSGEVSHFASAGRVTNDLKKALVELQKLIAKGYRYFYDDSGERDIFEVKKEYETKYQEFCDVKLEEYMRLAEESLPKYPQKAVVLLQQGLEELDQANTATKGQAEQMLDYAKDKEKHWEEADRLIQEVRKTQPPILEKLKQYRRARDNYADHPEIDQLLALSEQESNSYRLKLAQERLILLLARPPVNRPAETKVTTSRTETEVFTLEQITQLQAALIQAQAETLGELSTELSEAELQQARQIEAAYSSLQGLTNLAAQFHGQPEGLNPQLVAQAKRVGRLQNRLEKYEIAEFLTTSRRVWTPSRSEDLFHHNDGLELYLSLERWLASESQTTPKAEEQVALEERLQAQLQIKQERFEEQGRLIQTFIPLQAKLENLTKELETTLSRLDPPQPSLSFEEGLTSYLLWKDRYPYLRQEVEGFLDYVTGSNSLFLFTKTDFDRQINQQSRLLEESGQELEKVLHGYLNNHFNLALTAQRANNYSQVLLELEQVIPSDPSLEDKISTIIGKAKYDQSYILYREATKRKTEWEQANQAFKAIWQSESLEKDWLKAINLLEELHSKQFSPDYEALLQGYTELLTVNCKELHEDLQKAFHQPLVYQQRQKWQRDFIQALSRFPQDWTLKQLDQFCSKSEYLVWTDNVFKLPAKWRKESQLNKTLAQVLEANIGQLGTWEVGYPLYCQAFAEGEWIKAKQRLTQMKNDGLQGLKQAGDLDEALNHVSLLPGLLRDYLKPPYLLDYLEQISYGQEYLANLADLTEYKTRLSQNLQEKLKYLPRLKECQAKLQTTDVTSSLELSAAKQMIQWLEEIAPEEIGGLKNPLEVEDWLGKLSIITSSYLASNTQPENEAEAKKVLEGYGEELELNELLVTLKREIALITPPTVGYCYEDWIRVYREKCQPSKRFQQELSQYPILPEDSLLKEMEKVLEEQVFASYKSQGSKAEPPLNYHLAMLNAFSQALNELERLGSEGDEAARQQLLGQWIAIAEAAVVREVDLELIDEIKGLVNFNQVYTHLRRRLELFHGKAGAAKYLGEEALCQGVILLDELTANSRKSQESQEMYNSLAELEKIIIEVIGSDKMAEWSRLSSLLGELIEKKRQLLF